MKLTDRDIVILVGACFAGGCQRSDVDDFLAYISPVQQKTNLPFGTLEIDVAIAYGETIDPSTFEAALNNVPFAGFTPSPGTIEAVAVPLSPGRNTLVLQVDGQLSPGRTATDRDRSSFIVQNDSAAH